MTTTQDSFLADFARACSDIALQATQIPLIGSVLSGLIGAVCQVTVGIWALFPPNAFQQLAIFFGS